MSSNHNYHEFTSSILKVDERMWRISGSDESTVLHLVKKLETICTALAYTKDTIFSNSEKGEFISSKLGNELITILMREELEMIEEIIPGCRCHPVIEIAIAAINRVNAWHHARNLPVLKMTNKINLLVDTINAAVGEIREKMNSKEMKKTLKNYLRNSIENRKEMHHLVDSMFDKYAKILVVRLDLSYKKISSMPLDMQNISDTDVRSHLQSLLKDLKSKLFEGKLISYIWKLEYGPLKGYHYHTFFFFDGSQVRRDIDLANMIGKHWSEVSTQGIGTFFNCNLIKNAYLHRGIGMIDHRNVSKIELLKSKAIEYLVKVDFYVRPMANNKIRTFGKGATPRLKAVPRGRPRSTSKSIERKDGHNLLANSVNINPFKCNQYSPGYTLAS